MILITKKNGTKPDVAWSVATEAMTDTSFLQLSERWRLAYDRHQWIVQRRSGSDGKGRCERWRSCWFISSKRSTLIYFLLQDGAVVDDWRVIAMLPDTFREWIRMQAEASFKASDSDEREFGGEMPTPALAA